MYLNPLSGTSSGSYADLYAASSSTRSQPGSVGASSDAAAALVTTGASNATGLVTAQNLTQVAPPVVGGAQPSGGLTSSSQVASLLSRQSADSEGDPADTADFAPLQSMLTSDLERSMESENLVSPSGLAQATISFNNVGYSVDSNVAVSVNQQGLQLSTDQYESQFVGMGGSGQITLADGKVYDFNVSIGAGMQSEVKDTQTLATLPTSLDALDINGADSSSAQVVQGASINATTTSSSTANAAAASSNSTTSSTSTTTTSSNYLAQMIEAMNQTGTVVNVPGSSYQVNSVLIVPEDANGQSGQGADLTISSGSSGTSAKAAPAIDWDAIGQQTANLIELLGALAPADQSAGSSASSDTTNGISKAVSSAMTKVIDASQTHTTAASAAAAADGTTASSVPATPAADAASS